MILTNDIIKLNLQGYSNKDTKICREVKNENLINGLYETDSTINGYLLAGSIYGPSYLSFDFELSYYGIIPEKVTAFTNATYDKKKKKMYKTNSEYFYIEIYHQMFIL